MQVQIDGAGGGRVVLKGVRTCAHTRMKNVTGLEDPRLPKGTTTKKATVAFPCAKAVIATVTTDKHPDPEHIITDGSVTSLTNGGKVIGVVEANPAVADTTPVKKSASSKKAPSKKKSRTKKKAVASKESG